MATTKVGIYRKYHGPVPTDKAGRPLPKSDWPKKRAHSWVVRWFGADGKRYSKSFNTRKEAERFAEKKQGKVREGKADPPKHISLDDFAKEHARVMEGQVARATLVDQVRALKMFMGHVGKNALLRKVSPRHAESFVAARSAAGTKVATVNKDIRTLKRVFNLAIDPRGHLSPGHNPFAKIKQRKQSDRPIRYVAPQEFHLLLDAAPTAWWKALFGLLYSAGARMGEIVNLTWPDFDFEHARIRIVRKEASNHVVGWEPKDHEGRVLPIPDEVLQMLADLRNESADDCPYVFVPAWRWDYIQSARRAGQWDDKRSLLNNLNRRLATLRSRAGVAKFTYHDLRRSCITNWARHLPIHVVQMLAGHSDIKTTRQYYLSVQEDDLAKARRVQSEILRNDLTDPKVTHSGRTGRLSGPQREEEAA